MTAEDVVLVKEYAAKGCTILANGRICELVESAKTKEKEEEWKTGTKNHSKDQLPDDTGKE